MFMNEYSLRPLKPSDTPHWLEMWKEYMDFYQINLPMAVVKNTLNNLLSENKYIGCIVACTPQNVPIGFITYIVHLSTWSITPECYAHDLYVKTKYRNNGIGKMLIEELRLLSNRHQWNRIYWFTKPDNYVAQSLYNQIASSNLWIEYTLR
jgi:ribosomal protein S18 acetylase RimI-like enzyme